MQTQLLNNEKQRKDFICCTHKGQLKNRGEKKKVFFLRFVFFRCNQCFGRFWLDWCKIKINLDWKKYRAIHYFTISRVIIIFAYSRKLFMGTFCGIVSLEMETVANDWLASVGNWKWQKTPYSLLSFLGHARSNYRLDSWTSLLILTAGNSRRNGQRLVNSGHATISPNALVACSHYILQRPHLFDIIRYSFL